MSAKVHKILVVEDDSSIRLGLVQILNMKEFKTVEAENGEEALRVLKATSDIDLVLLDLMMPVMNGIEFRERQLKDPQLAKIPVIVMSAAQDPRQKVENLEIKTVLKKPLKLQELLKSIESAFD